MRYLRIESGIPRLVEQLSFDPDTTILTLAQQDFDHGLELYVNRHGKDWSLTDCISFVVVRDQNLTEPLTADH